MQTMVCIFTINVLILFIMTDDSNIDLNLNFSTDLVFTPLAERLRPKTLTAFIGQNKIIGPTSRLFQYLKTKKIPSLILWGPPGCGKTTLALILAKEVQSHFINVNAVEIGSKILKEIGEQARHHKLFLQQSTVVFIDEIHRLNKSQQDILLPFVEKGDFTLIGATTENPSYEINRALLSRCQILVFEKLTPSDLEKIFIQGIKLLKWNNEDIDQQLKLSLCDLADGDARKLLNDLETLLTSSEAAQVPRPLTIDNVAEWLPKKILLNDKNADLHYDLISAFIKSIRGSDADAALYYFSRMLEGGEDPIFIARRLIILASEDVGNADPKALPLAISGLQALEAIGLPEGAICLAQVVTYLATAPKSNRSYMALRQMQNLVKETGNAPIPLHLRSSKTSEMKNLGYGKDYLYPHDYLKSFVVQNYLPDEISKIKSKKFYEPKDIGYEKHIREYQEWLKK